MPSTSALHQNESTSIDATQELPPTEYTPTTPSGSSIDSLGDYSSESDELLQANELRLRPGIAVNDDIDNELL